MPFLLAGFSGISWLTSQCSTILPFSTRKMSTTAWPRSSGGFAPQVVDHHQVALGNDTLDVDAGLRMLLEVMGEEVHHRLDAIAHVGVVLDVVLADVQAHRLVDVAVLEHHAEKRHHDVLVGLRRGGLGRRHTAGGQQQAKGQRFELHAHTDYSGDRDAGWRFASLQTKPADSTLPPLRLSPENDAAPCVQGAASGDPERAGSVAHGKAAARVLGGLDLVGQGNGVVFHRDPALAAGIDQQAVVA